MQRYGATAMIYIGELCRYSLNTPPCEAEKNNPIRVALGNGTSSGRLGAVPEAFRHFRRFASSTARRKRPAIIVNLAGKTGLRRPRADATAVGKLKIVRYDVDTDDYVRDVERLLRRVPVPTRSASSSSGSTTSPAAPRPSSAATRTTRLPTRRSSTTSSQQGDRYYRSGDLMRYDEEDFFYFVDRIGDTYRWKGENVSTAEVADVLAQAPGRAARRPCSASTCRAWKGRRASPRVVLENGSFDAQDVLARRAGAPFVRAAAVRPHHRHFDTTGDVQDPEDDSPARRESIRSSQAGRIYRRQDDGYSPLTPELWSQIAAGGGRL